MKLVREAMSRGVVSVRVDTELREIAKTLNRYDISGVAVTDPIEGTVGVISHTDLVKHMGENGLTAEDVMTELPETIRPDRDLLEAAEKMSKQDVHRLFVMPSGEIFECNTCMGIITTTDLIEAMAEGN